MQSVHSATDIELKDLPTTLWALAFGVALFAFGLALELGGYPVEAGISGALALFFVAVAVLGQLIVWGLGRLN